MIFFFLIDAIKVKGQSDIKRQNETSGHVGDSG